MHFEEWMENVVKAFEIAGVVILAVGSIVTLVRAATVLARGEHHAAYQTARRGIGRSVLLGLEVLIIADIVQTITIDATVETAAVLAIIVPLAVVMMMGMLQPAKGVVLGTMWWMGMGTFRQERPVGHPDHRDHS